MHFPCSHPVHFTNPSFFLDSQGFSTGASTASAADALARTQEKWRRLRDDGSDDMRDDDIDDDDDGYHSDAVADDGCDDMGGGDDGHVDADGNCSDDMGSASTGYVRHISSKNRRYVRDPVHPKPCVIDRSLTRKERKKQWKDWAVSLARFDCIVSCD